MREPPSRATGLVGDGYDEERLLTAKEVGQWLGIPYKRVYGLPIPQVRVTQRCIRYEPRSVKEYIERRTQAV